LGQKAKLLLLLLLLLAICTSAIAEHASMIQLFVTKDDFSYNWLQLESQIG
jgi:hypothetical protein